VRHRRSNDDFGKDYLKGVVDGLGSRATSMIKVKASYETTDATVNSQIVEMQAAGCDAFVNIAIPKFAAQAVRRAAEVGWKPLQLLIGIAASVGVTLKPAGLEKAKGVITDNSFKDPADPESKNDAGYKWWSSFMDKYYRSGDNLTRENVMRQAAKLHNLELPLLLPGITINTSPTDFAPIKQVQMKRLDGERFVAFGPILSGTIG